jgi:hypothetical protein
MALNFPDTPSLNQTFTANNVTWRWTGTYWKSQGTGASLYIGDSPPANPASGTMWFESTTGKTYIYYKDADSSQWVELGGSSASTALTLGAFTTSNLAEGSNLYFTTARATAAARSAITVSGAATYDSATGVLAIGGNITSVNGQTGAVTLNTSNIAEDTSLYFTPARARSSITVTGPATYDTATGVITVQGNINSVNGQANAVTLTTTDIPEGTNQYFTTARARAAISATGIVAYNSATGVISLTTGIPRITSVVITDSSYVAIGATALSTAYGGYIKLTGTDFVSGSQVYVNTTAASSTAFVSSTEVRAQLPAQSAGTYILYLVGTDGATAISVSGVTFIAGLTTTSTTTTTTAAPTTTTTSTTTTTTAAPATVEYLVVAGGGGGASAVTSNVRGGGGGGAGGFRTGSATNYQRGSVYSITVGGGGPGATVLGNDGNNGNPSSFDTISSIGGGGGGSQGRLGKDGGSGGGGSGGSGGGSGTAGQGFAGGSSSSSGTTSGGGGGGSFGVGADGGGSYFSGTAGGAGTSNAITGTSATYAAGGRGGGGNGDSPVAAAVNSGNGGLGGGNPNGGDGGSGIVIIAYPNTFPALQSVSVGLTYDQPVRSGYRVYRFTAGTGTITW